MRGVYVRETVTCSVAQQTLEGMGGPCNSETDHCFEQNVRSQMKIYAEIHMRCVTSSPTRGYIGVTRAFRHQHGSVDLARICTGTLSSGEAIAKCTGCRKYVNTATSPDCRSDRLPLGKCHNLLEYGIPMEFQQQAQHW